MKKYTVAAAILALVIPALPARAQGGLANLDFVINVLPASLIVDMDSDQFRVTSPSGTTVEMTEVYHMPNISMGLGMETGDWYLDAMVGVGAVLNESFRSFMVQGVLSASYQASQSLKMGPHLGVIHFPDPEWQSDGDVDFDGTTGLLAGLHLTMGDKITYYVSVDLVTADFDAEGATGESALELSGLALQFGVRGQF
jgi:hypothetical protein